MKNIRICLDSIDKVKTFVSAISVFTGEFDLLSGRYVIDAKSIMGIFSLDLSNDIELKIYPDPTDSVDAIMAAIKPFIVE